MNHLIRYKNALIVYRIAENVPNGYKLQPTKVPEKITVPEPDPSFAYQLSALRESMPAYGEGVIQGMSIDPVTGQIMVEVMAYGILCVMALSLAVVAFA